MRYKNKKVILVCGYSRGGTNIVWNLLQSHPQITTPIYETEKIFCQRERFGLGRVISVLKKTRLMDTVFAKMVIDYHLYRYKMLSLKHPDNKFKSPSEIYTMREVSESSLCLKSVDYDIQLTDLLLSIYPNMPLIFVVRNGYAVIEGHIRRGESVERASQLYSAIYERMRYYIDHHPKTMIIKFEDAINDPFGMSKKLLKFCDLENNELEFIRLKSKKTISKNGRHEAGFGKKEIKYWFDKESIHKIIVKDINRNQIERLDKASIDVINKNASEALDYFGYKKIQQLQGV